MIGAAATVSGVVLLLALKQPGNTVAGAVQAGSQVPPAGSASAGTGAAAAGAQTVLGDVAGTQYGDVQVQLTLSGGRITGAQAVKAPSADARSRQIAADAIPKLNQAVVTAQGARIDTVSGASYTSEGYIKSLQSALDKAGAAEAAGSAAGESGSDGSGAQAGAQPGAGTQPGGGSGSGSSSGSGTGSGTGSGSGSGSDDAPAAKTVLGDVADTQYGPVQVRITVGGGKVTAADAVKTPSSDPNSKQIAANAVPKLNQAAVRAQSAQIDAVSGASYTSEGYIKSLQSALDKAGL
ncbi:FMN-binding protein [Streptomyces sp. ISL-1]|uniref:FMN-binding protein n=1 Tax=Streptomyces sp. ISL-1 TaxID=2817657 RepID=UPI001BEAE2BC|nr:FMN-binding protein [Streptomyces sp. ISL-1]MBT2391472.1 FMN-binding protein [Streptomyces sp. ISL-1]